MKIQLSKSEISELKSMLAFAANEKHSTKPYNQVVHMVILPDKVLAVATDGKRMTIHKLFDADNENALAPAQVVLRKPEILGMEPGEYEIVDNKLVAPNGARLGTDDAYYPDYRNVIPCVDVLDTTGAIFNADFLVDIREFVGRVYGKGATKTWHPGLLGEDKRKAHICGFARTLFVVMPILDAVNENVEVRAREAYANTIG